MAMLGPLLERISRALGAWDRTANQRWGARGEKAAAAFLRGAGYRVIGKNLRTRVGEADLLCRAPDRRTIVLVEVKTRVRSPDQPDLSAKVAPEAAITARKRRTLVRLARLLAKANGWTQNPMRIDVVAVEWQEGAKTPTIRHHVGAVKP